ncbi:MAG: hypothetical protein JWN14_1328, partial [Chthonomonadales bacterium]|nr:hypothetical protein [Chthonomonadales bacterium]
MLRRILLVLFFALMIGGMSQRPAHAHYDDVHYTLNYYLARVIGYTPTQAHRMASLCYWIDYAPETEPTQIEHGVEALTSSKAVTVEALGTGLYRVLNALHITRLGNSIDPNKMNAEILDELDKLPGDVERLAKREDMRDVFEAQWRFHAFRDLYRFPESAVAGPDATAADAAIVEQHRLLWKEAFDLKNPGVFLHFFQDELPHSGYVVGGGHWVVPPGRKAVGGSTDWLSYYPEGVNQRTILETAKYMIEFMAKSSGGHQKPLISTPEGVLAHVQK